MSRIYYRGAKAAIVCYGKHSFACWFGQISQAWNGGKVQLEGVKLEKAVLLYCSDTNCYFHLAPTSHVAT